MNWQDLLLQVGLLSLGSILAWVTRSYIKDARLKTLLEALAKIVTASVASKYQLVSDLKDPDKPGEWTDVKAIETKAQVIEEVKTMGQPVIKGLESVGVKETDKLVGQMVEQSVVQLKSAQTPTLLAVGEVLKDGEQP